MILTDVLLKFSKVSKHLNEEDRESSGKEEKEMRELIIFLAQKNIWTLEDLKKALK